MRSIKSDYRALIVDVDGTTVPHDFKALPSKKLVAAISEAQKKVFVGIATARPYYYVRHVVEHMGLTGPCVVNSGAQIVDVLTGKVLHEQLMIDADVEAVCALASDMGVRLLLNTKEKDVKVSDMNKFAGKIYGTWAFPAVDEEIIDLFMDRISNISTIAASKTPSNTRGKSYVAIGHAKSTKQYGVLEVSRILNIKTDDIIGVGDGDNDFPLLMACGLRVAMGNAVDGLKEIADYVAPSVFEDGLVDVIERFVLKSN
jgi:HAD superfamily hydrolase (TIGR01484 family)